MIDIKGATEGLTNEEIKTYVNTTSPEVLKSLGAQYKGMQSIFDETLVDYKDKGFSLYQPDDHFLELFYRGKRVAIFNQTRATIEIIRETCKHYLEG